MSQRLFSICTPCPQGFQFCTEFRTRDFRSAPFALYAASCVAAQDFLSSAIEHLVGIVLVPGEQLATRSLAPRLTCITISPALSAYLADFAVNQLEQLEGIVEAEDRASRLALENERLTINNQRSSEEFSQFRSSLLREIEERRVAERQLAEREELLRLILASTGEAIYGIDMDGCCTFANEACLRLLGYAQIGDVLGRNMHELIHYRTVDGSPLPVEECRIFKAFREGCGISAGNEVFFRSDGSSFPVEYSSYPLQKNERIIGAVIVWRDITERRRIERSTALMNFALENIREAVFLIDEQARFSYVNNEACRELGYSREELVRMGTADVDPDFPAAQWLQHWEELRARGSMSLESRHRARDGRLFPVEVNANYFEYDGKGYNLALVRDISEEKRRDEAMQEMEERFRSIMALSPDIISIISGSGELLYNSPAAHQIHGYTEHEMQGVNTLELIHPEDRAEVTRVFQELLEKPFKTLSTQYRYRNKDGSYTWMECSANNQLANPLISGVIAVSRDISDRKKLEDDRLTLERQLLHTQKLESLGVLAGGIAHDFNNILMAIIGNADLALMRINRESPAVENLHRIEQAAARAADLAKQMLAYSGKGRFVVEQLDLNRMLEEMLHMLEVSISKKAVLRLDLTRPLPTVEADATQMRQIIMNLVINASEAIGEKSGVIAITTGCMDCDKAYLKDVWLDENIGAGLYIYLEIADSGCGMDRNTMARIFDPFFTTKFTGRGLGMAAVMGIVRGHKGAIKVYSEPGKGSVFKILLPASSRPPEMFNVENRADGWSGSGTVLLVDDEETVRGIGSEMLKELGFKPVTANNGREALEIFRSDPAIDVVILDLTMPHMDGEECFRELRRIRPEVKVIMSSGYNEQEVTQRFVGKGLAGFMQKPYKLSVLRDALRALHAKET